jgi:hypothetical protein
MILAMIHVPCTEKLNQRPGSRSDSRPLSRLTIPCSPSRIYTNRGPLWVAGF